MKGASKEGMVRETLLDEIRKGVYRIGDRLPPEIELASRFRISRPTVARALAGLERMGMLDRRVGAGTFVTGDEPRRDKQKLFGLLIPGLGATEIYEPMCASITALSDRHSFSLVWSGTGNKESHAEEILRTCRRYREQNVDGIFFAPLDSDEENATENMKVLDFLEDQRIPVVLLDRDVAHFPHRSKWDLVSSDHFRAGFSATEYLLSTGAQRVDFLYTVDTPLTVRLRMMGYREALLNSGVHPKSNWVHIVDSPTPESINEIVKTNGATNLLCGNDKIAVQTINSLERSGIRVPQEVRVVGFNDLAYARTFHIPLTTWHHPCDEEGISALYTLLDRIQYPELPARTVQVCGDIVIRESA